MQSQKHPSRKFKKVWKGPHELKKSNYERSLQKLEGNFNFNSLNKKIDISNLNK